MRQARGEIERSLERADSSALGFMADDVVVATFEFPRVSDAGRAALEQFINLLDSFAGATTHGIVVMSPPVQMRMHALSDSLVGAKIRLAGPDSQAVAVKMRDAARAILEGSATGEQLADVRDCAESLGIVTLDWLFELRSGGSTPWTSQTLNFS